MQIEFILLILSILFFASILVFPMVAKKETVRFELPLNIIAGMMTFLFVWASWGGETAKGISRLEGSILLLVFLVFLFYNLKSAKSDVAQKVAPKMSLWKCVLLILVGLASLVLGGELVVRSATKIAQQMGISESVIGLTVVALGTSLPELATSVMAAYKHNSDIALGNVVGSNIFNVFFILGTSALIKPLPAYQGVELDTILVALSGAIVWLLLICNKKRTINRWGGALLLVVYAVYLSFRLVAI